MFVFEGFKKLHFDTLAYIYSLDRKEQAMKLVATSTVIFFMLSTMDAFAEKLKYSKSKIRVWKKSVGSYEPLVKINAKLATDVTTIKGATVRVIADNMLPYIASSNGTEELGGYLGDIWAIIATALQFKSEISSHDYDTGVEKMTRKEADVMLAAAVEKRGQPNIVYSQPYFYNWYHLYVKKPESRPSSDSYVKIFSKELWFASAALMMVLTLSLWVTFRWSTYRSEPAVSIFSCFLIVSSGFLSQGFDLKPRSYSARIQVFLSLVIGYLLYSAMNAVLVARLANLEERLPFLDLEDIAVKRTHSLCLRTNSFVYNNFTDANKTVLPTWKGILNGPGCLDINNQTNLAKIACNDGVIFLENRVVMSTVINNNDLSCQITFHPQKYFKGSNSFILLRTFYYKRIINKMIKHLKATGILSRLDCKWIKKYNQPSGGNQKSFPQVTLHHIAGILQLFLAVVAVSLLILAAEFLYHKPVAASPYVN